MIPIIFFVLFSFSLIYIFFGFHILLKNRYAMTNRIFFSLCTNLSCWAFGYAFMSIAPNEEVANFWRMVSALGWCIVYATWLDFAILVKAESKKWMTDVRRLFIYLPSLFFFIGNLRYKPNQVMERLMFVWKDTYPLDILEILYIAYYITFSAAGVIIIYKWGKSSAFKREQKQANIIVLTAVTSFILVILTDAILPMLDIKIFPIGIIMLFITLLGISYAITEYKMMTLSSDVASDYILSTISDPVILIGNDSIIKEVNSATLAVTRFSESELIGHPISLFVDNTELNQTTYNELMSTGFIKNVEVALHAKNSSSIPCLVSGSLIKNEAEDVLGIAFILRDITDRKNAENILVRSHQELEEKVRERTAELEEINALLEEEIDEHRKVQEELLSSDEKFKALIKHSSDGIMVLDQVTREIVEINEKAYHLLEIPSCQAPELIEEQLMQGNRDKIQRVMDHIFEKKRLSIKETIKYTQENGTQKDLELSATLVGYNNKQFMMLTISDITEKLIMEERKHQMVKMEYLGTLSGGIAHDFNNILAGIMGYTQLTVEGLDEDTSSIEYLSEVLKLGERAKKLISQILTFSKKTHISPEIVDFKSITEEVLKMLKITLPANIIIRDQLGNNPIYVYADLGELHQLITNLCVNAELAMKKSGGIMEVNLTEVIFNEDMEIAYQKVNSGQYIKLEVIDSGCGMEDTIIKRIFEPFYTTRGMHGGTGLGLSVVHGIVSRYEGVIVVESELNKGSTFTVYIPSVLGNDKDLSLPNEVLKSTAARILFVDDEESIVNSTRKLLQRVGYSVTGVIDPREAIRIFSENKDAFDIILTDQSMPTMMGDDLVKELRRIRPEIPVVICSGYIHKNDEEDNVREITEFLLKPVSKIEYVHVIEKLLRNK